MAEDIPFNREFDAPAGEVVQLSPLVRRILAPNPGPFTFLGTNTYIVGRGTVAVIDPGPNDPAHIAAILAALDGEAVSHVVVSHTHMDHSPGAAPLVAATGARLVGCDAYRRPKAAPGADQAKLDAGNDTDYIPQQAMAEGDSIAGPGWTLSAIETPGHASNHLAFALPEENALFSADHVMAWSTSVVAPPDGSMTDYMVSLNKLRERDDAVYWPGHGGPVNEPKRFVRALLLHRRQREASILARIVAGDETVEEIVPRLYEGLAQNLIGAAKLSVYAHIEDLVQRGKIVTDGEATMQGRFRPA